MYVPSSIPTLLALSRSVIINELKEKLERTVTSFHPNIFSEFVGHADKVLFAF